MPGVNYRLHDADLLHDFQLFRNAILRYRNRSKTRKGESVWSQEVSGFWKSFCS